ncbi:hypothetical protein BJF78_14425 [Pseudonocardia sp. CNS-139]|nr:hypothetical protein BJF78_14425 [Pseudonocardia sp. CNS-139]
MAEARPDRPRALGQGVGQPGPVAVQHEQRLGDRSEADRPGPAEVHHGERAARQLVQPGHRPARQHGPQAERAGQAHAGQLLGDEHPVEQRRPVEHP